MSEDIIKLLTQPVCMISKANKNITYGNPAMLKLHSTTVGINFDDIFKIIDNNNVTFDIFTQNETFDEKPYLIKLLNTNTNNNNNNNTSSSYYHGYFSQVDQSSLILLLTPCLLKNEIIENEFLRNHENVIDVIENAPIPIHICKSSGEYIWANKNEYQLLGCPIGDLRGKNVSEVNIRIYILIIVFIIYMQDTLLKCDIVLITIIILYSIIDLYIP